MAAAASPSSILDRANPTWISTHSPGLGGSSESRPTLMTRRTPLTSTLARSGCSGRNSITSPGMPRHMCCSFTAAAGSPGFGDQVHDHTDGRVDGVRDRGAQLHYVVEAGGLAANDEHPRAARAEHLEHAEDHIRLHAVGIEQPAFPERPAGVRVLRAPRVDHGHGARLLPSPD